MPTEAEAQTQKDVAAAKASVTQAGTDMQQSIGRQAEEIASQKAEAEPIVAAAKGLMEEQQRRLAEPLPEPPKFGTPPKVADYFNKNVGTMLLTAAQLVAGIGAGSGKVRGIRAMNSLASGLNGYREGNLQAAEMGLADYRNQMEAQLKEYQLLVERNNNVIARGNMSINQKINELQLNSAVHGMAIEQETLAQHGIQAFINQNKDLADISFRGMSATLQVKQLEEQIAGRKQQLALESRRIGLESQRLNIEKQHIQQLPLAERRQELNNILTSLQKNLEDERKLPTWSVFGPHQNAERIRFYQDEIDKVQRDLGESAKITLPPAPIQGKSGGRPSAQARLNNLTAQGIGLDEAYKQLAKEGY
jgi:hypothetical protein